MCGSLSENLRERANVMLGERCDSGVRCGAGLADRAVAFEELAVRQAELEIQNEDLRRTQMELSDLHREYVELYYESAPCGYVTLNRRGFIERINIAGASLLGIDRDDLTNKPFWTFVDPESESAYFNTTRRLKETKCRQSVELKLVREKAPSVWVMADIVQDLDEAGEIRRYRIALADITERIEAEKRLAASNAELASLNAALEERMAERTEELSETARKLRDLTLELSEIEDRTREGISQMLHDDLQQHLAASLFNLQILLANEIRNQGQKKKFSEVEKLIRESIQKTRSLSHELSPPVLRRNGLLPALEWLAEDMLAKHGLHVDLRWETGAEPDSPSLCSMLFASVKELLFNSAKHSGSKEASVEAKDEGDTLTISVADRGRGCLERDVMKKQDEGSSLGLFKIKERIEYLGGRYELDTAPGEGFRATLRLPKSKGGGKKEATGAENSRPTARASDLSGNPQPGRNETIRILLADDHAAVREAMASLFEFREGFEVVGQAEDGLEAVRLAEETRPDVVLMDVSMQRMDGVEATARIKRKLPGTCVVGLSMHEDNDVRNRMLSAGAAAYHYKAAPLDRLFDTIRKVREARLP